MEEIELHPIGCARLVAATVQNALLFDGYGRRDSQFYRQRARVLANFMESDLIDYFADAYRIDPSRVRKALERRIFVLWEASGVEGTQ